jgi:hypothetical protein
MPFGCFSTPTHLKSSPSKMNVENDLFAKLEKMPLPQSLWFSGRFRGLWLMRLLLCGSAG